MTISINGAGNIVNVSSESKFRNAHIEINSNNCIVNIESGVLLNNFYARLSYGGSQKLVIGSGTTIWGASVFLDEESGLIVGKDCMFSDSITIWGSDGHAIIDSMTGKVLNPVLGCITVGDHTWVGQGARLTKNARFPQNSIVGMVSLVTKEFTEPNTVIAGSPAKIIKTGVNWRRENGYWLNNNTGIKS